MTYVGRFAPSPTGPLHMGSLYAAVCSYLDARAQSGKWLLRIEDIDPPREQKGAAENIISTLASYGFEWDGEPVHQSNRTQMYENALTRLTSIGAVYACPCSRKELQSLGRHTNSCPVRDKDTSQFPVAIRLKRNHAKWSWDDLFLGDQQRTDADEAVLKRKDALYAYQLAVVCDDIDQGITHIIRGRDLFDCTPIQLHLYQLLGKRAPHFGHLPLVLNESGQKLSKQNLAPAVKASEAITNLKVIGHWLKFQINAHYPSPEQMLKHFVMQWSRASIGIGDLVL